MDFQKIIWKKSHRAKQLTLKVAPCTTALSKESHKITLTTPLSVCESTAQKFVQAQEAWLKKAIQKIPPIIHLSQASTLPLHGIDRPILYGGKSEPNAISLLSPRQLKPWLYKYSHECLQTEVDKFAKQLNVTIANIRICNTRSRWGSCNHLGCLSFSWRLILTPYDVMSYVAAHEVAHRLEMNHSPAFWKIVESLYPRWKEQKKWMNTNAIKILQFHI